MSYSFFILSLASPFFFLPLTTLFSSLLFSLSPPRPSAATKSTDACLFEDPGFKVHAERYAADPKAFDADYAAAHAKLSELGAEWE